MKIPHNFNRRNTLAALETNSHDLTDSMIFKRRNSVALGGVGDESLNTDRQSESDLKKKIW